MPYPTDKEHMHPVDELFREKLQNLEADPQLASLYWRSDVMPKPKSPRHSWRWAYLTALLLIGVAAYTFQPYSESKSLAKLRLAHPAEFALALHHNDSPTIPAVETFANPGPGLNDHADGRPRADANLPLRKQNLHSSLNRRHDTARQNALSVQAEKISEAKIPGLASSGKVNNSATDTLTKSPSKTLKSKVHIIW